MQPSFAGKLALVTGGSRGIGRAIALKLGSLGAEVIVNYARREEDANRVVAELTELGARATPLRANLGDLDELHGLFVEVKERWGGLDILINSAARGLERPRNAIASLPNHLRQTFDLNVLGPWFATKEAAPLMEARGGGAVINLTSLGAQRYVPNYAAVAVSKGALDTLTMYLAVELAPKHIRVNGVCPSWVDDPGAQHPGSPPRQPQRRCEPGRLPLQLPGRDDRRPDHRHRRRRNPAGANRTVALALLTSLPG
jgi:enoyl-[acyl-carrier protein] reductase III